MKTFTFQTLSGQTGTITKPRIKGNNVVVDLITATSAYKDVYFSKKNLLELLIDDHIYGFELINKEFQNRKFTFAEVYCVTRSPRQ